MLSTGIDHTIEMTRHERERIFNLGYYTWVEQQGVSVEGFDRRRDAAFWDGLIDYVPIWDEKIDGINRAAWRKW